jgi:heptosyltransferase-1
MHILIIKTSSLGDLIHTFPALTDAAKAVSDIRFDWLVEESFAEVPAWHPAVNRVIPIGLRQWRKGWGKAWKNKAIQQCIADLRSTNYDLVIDAQGLVKSAIPAVLAHGPVAGYNKQSIREPLASLFYQQSYAAPREWHAVKRIRHLFAQALGYQINEFEIDYGLHFDGGEKNDTIVFLHSTTWASKHWPDTYWAELAQIVRHAGLSVALPWHTPEERLRAECIIKAAGSGRLLDRMNLTTMAQVLAQARGVVGVDSGLAHIAAAVATPAVTLYGSTDVKLTGAVGVRQKNLQADFACAPCLQRQCTYSGKADVSPACYSRLSPGLAWQNLQQQMDKAQ